MQMHRLFFAAALLGSLGCTTFDDGSNQVPAEVEIIAATYMVSTQELAPGGDCETGGVRIRSGLDSDGDGFLEDNEVAEAANLCNGSAGVATGVTLSDMSCGDDEILVFSGNEWACAAQPLVTLGDQCEDGQVPRWETNEFVCGDATDTLSTLEATCGDGQVPRYDSGEWTCVDVADTDTLASLGCFPGQIPKWSGTEWACGVDEDQAGADTLAELNCFVGQVAKWSGAGWTCSDDVTGGGGGTDTLATLAAFCGTDQIARFDGTEWLCADDADALAELAFCGLSDVLAWDGTEWVCATDADTLASSIFCDVDQVLAWDGAAWQCADDVDTLGALEACATGQVPKWDGAGWGCGNDEQGAGGADTLASLPCNGGEIAEYDGAAWACVANTDADTLGALITCGVGQVAEWNGAAWDCADDDVGAGGTDTLASLPCNAGEIAEYDGAAWACVTNTDADTLGLLAGCGAGNVAEYDGAAWQCIAPIDADSLGALAGCALGDIPEYDGAAWQCVTPVDADTLAALPCANGEIARFDGTDWVCSIEALDDDSGLWSLAGNAGVVDGTDFIGTTDAAPVEVRVNNAQAARFNTDGSVELGANADANGNAGAMVFADTTAGGFTAGAANEFAVRAYGGFRMVAGAGGTELVTFQAGDAGWQLGSDRTAKDGIAKLDGEEVLARIQAFDVHRWSYIGHEDIDHAGPMAQDFYAAFALGRDERHLGASDVAGVNMAAIKALAERTDALAEDNARLRAQNEELLELTRALVEAQRRGDR